MCIFCDELSTKATLTWDGEIGYNGHVSGHGRWNGFAIPAFTKEVIEQIQFDTDGVEGCAQLRLVGNTLIVDYPENPDEPDMFEPTECCKTYPLGAWSWTWYEMGELAKKKELAKN